MILQNYIRIKSNAFCYILKSQHTNYYCLTETDVAFPFSDSHSFSLSQQFALFLTPFMLSLYHYPSIQQYNKLCYFYLNLIFYFSCVNSIFHTFPTPPTLVLQFIANLQWLSFYLGGTSNPLNAVFVHIFSYAFEIHQK